MPQGTVRTRFAAFVEQTVDDAGAADGDGATASVGSGHRRPQVPRMMMVVVVVMVRVEPVLGPQTVLGVVVWSGVGESWKNEYFFLPIIKFNKLYNK